VLACGRVSHGTAGQGRSVEDEFAGWFGVPYAVAVANGTVALEAGHAFHRYVVRLRPELPRQDRMSEADADDVITAVRRVLGEAAG
jgi:dTDP-4-amino-4,6-dideoxygalactose transaminase